MSVKHSIFISVSAGRLFGSLMVNCNYVAGGFEKINDSLFQYSFASDLVTCL